ncbi:hypothetical protein CYY_009984 [Polysphondylium violaceum]|uniref:Uncharacterized protein n=1 Tax=Polysphondylium violaceum TaxID=133409 RepID=A0A8J4PK92_9MYCE|nr:hypothetical protein CYY_009984 [Polysphondylium violaceum]
MTTSLSTTLDTLREKEFKIRGELKFKFLKEIEENFKEILYIYQKNKNSPIELENSLRYLNAQHKEFKKVLEDSLQQFQEKYLINGHLYLETSSIYLSFLRDTFFNYKEWKLEQMYYINVKASIQDFIRKTHFYLVEYLKENQYRMLEDYSVLSCKLLYKDLVLYPFNQSWVQKKENNTPILLDEKENHVYSINLSNNKDIVIDEFSQSVNSVTGVNGIKTNTLRLGPFQSTLPSKMSFRFYSIIKKANQFTKMEIKIINQENGYTDNLFYNEKFDSTTGKVGIYQSNQYPISNEFYIEANIKGDFEESTFLSFDIIDCK